MDDARAGDRYRIEARSGGVLRAVLTAARRGGRGRVAGRVSIVDHTGTVVWTRDCKSSDDQRTLIRVIEEQVFTARLADFEHWLRTEGTQT